MAHISIEKDPNISIDLPKDFYFFISCSWEIKPKTGAIEFTTIRKRVRMSNIIIFNSLSILIVN